MHSCHRKHRNQWLAIYFFSQAYLKLTADNNITSRVSSFVSVVSTTLFFAASSVNMHKFYRIGGWITNKFNRMTTIPGTLTFGVSRYDVTCVIGLSPRELKHRQNLRSLAAAMELKFGTQPYVIVCRHSAYSSNDSHISHCRPVCRYFRPIPCLELLSLPRTIVEIITYQHKATSAGNSLCPTNNYEP